MQFDRYIGQTPIKNLHIPRSKCLIRSRSVCLVGILAPRRDNESSFAVTNRATVALVDTMGPLSEQLGRSED
jgi:hypothetical protein